MHTLPLSFKLLTISGFWRPVHWSSNTAGYRIYNLFSVVMLLFLHSYTTLGIMDAFFDDNLNNFIDKFSLFISVFGVSLKVTNLFIRRAKIIALLDMLKTEDCIPRDAEEALIREKFNDEARQITIFCECLNEATAVMAGVAYFDNYMRKYNTPEFSWVLYDVSTPFLFWATLFRQSIGIIMCANASVAHETLISGLMIQTSAQLELLCHRVRSLPMTFAEAARTGMSEKELVKYERGIIGQLVRQHLYIYKFAASVNTVFTLMIFLQFSISSTVLCMSVYKMSTKSMLSIEFLWTALYLASMLMQIFLYCWFGNEVTLKSIEFGQAIYEMDWTPLRTNVTKDLLFMMARTVKPIKMTSGHIIVLSVQSFTSILKMSYSTFNVLQSSKKSH